MSEKISSAQAYQYSVTGVDTQNIAWFNLLNKINNQDQSFYSSPVKIDTLTTISFSVHESRRPVRSLGFRSVKAYTTGIRTIAGSMIMSIVTEHPLKSLMDEYKKYRSTFGHWEFSLDQNQDGSGYATSVNGIENDNNYYSSFNILPTILPPFNIAFTSITELSNLKEERFDFQGIPIGKQYPYTNLMLFGVQFIDDGLVLSTNNTYTEMTFSFVAQDYAVINEKETFQNLLTQNLAETRHFDSAFTSNSESNSDKINEVLTNIKTNSTKYIKF